MTSLFSHISHINDDAFLTKSVRNISESSEEALTHQENKTAVDPLLEKIFG